MIETMVRTFKYKWQAKLYGKWLWLKNTVTTRNIVYHKYGYIVKYPEQRWTVSKILITDPPRITKD